MSRNKYRKLIDEQKKKGERKREVKKIEKQFTMETIKALHIVI